MGLGLARELDQISQTRKGVFRSFPHIDAA